MELPKPPANTSADRVAVLEDRIEWIIPNVGTLCVAINDLDKKVTAADGERGQDIKDLHLKLKALENRQLSELRAVAYDLNRLRRHVTLAALILAIIAVIMKYG